MNINQPPSGYAAQLAWCVQAVQKLWKRITGIEESGGSGGSGNATSIQGNAVSATTPLVGQYLKYAAMGWGPDYVTIGDHIASASQGLTSISLTGQLANITGNVGDIVRINAGGDPVFLSPIGVIPIIQAVSDLTTQTTSLATVTSYAQPNTAPATFKVGGYINIIAISVNTLALTVGWTDENNNARTQNFFPMGATAATLSAPGFTAFPEVTIRVKKNSTITVSTTASGVGSQNYDVGASITQIN